jgi:hypothetical protein
MKALRPSPPTVVLTLLAILLAVVVSGCVTPTVDTPPRWITGVDEAHPDGTRFVAYGRSSERSAARDAAVADAFRRIEQLIIRRLEKHPVTLGADAGARIEEIARNRVETIERLDEFRRIDAMENHEVFLLLLYRDSELQADAETVAGRSLTKDDSRPSLGETSEGTTGSSLDTVRRIMEEDIPASAAAREEQLRRALAAAADIVITLQPGERTVSLGDETSHTMRVNLQDRVYPDAVSGIPLTVGITGPVIDGNPSTSRRRVFTMDDGSVSVIIPPRQFAGTTVITAQPEWFEEASRRWSRIASSPDEEALLSTLTERLTGSSVLEVTSRAGTVPTAIIILDRDIAGNPITGTDTMAGVLQEMGAQGFRVRRVELTAADRDRLAGLDSIEVSDLYDILPFDVLAAVDRAIVGDGRILSFNENEGFNVVVETSAVTFDLRRDRRLAAVSVTERISGSSAQATIRAAFQESGRRLARRLAPQLP